MTTDSTLESKLKFGVALMMMMRWIMRLMGLLNTVILARLLTPADFGIVAMAIVFQALIEELISLNVQLVLIRNQEATTSHYNSAWTIGIIQFGLIALIVVAGSGLAADYYQEPRLQPVIYVTALAMFLRGFVNIGVVNFRKNLDFGLDVKYELLNRATRMVATIIFAFWLRSYWAMVLGILSGSVAAVVFSYVLSPFRPRLSLAKSREIFSISLGIWFESLNRFLAMQVDRLILGRLLSTTALGGYSIAVDLARLPSAELVMPLSRALVPGYAKVKNEAAKIAWFFVTLIRVASLCAAPIAFGFPIIAGDFVEVILSEKWLSIVPMLKIAAVLAVIELLAGANRPLLLAVGKFKPLNTVLSITTLSIIAVIYPAFQWHGVQGVLMALMGVQLLNLLALFWLSSRALQVAYRTLFIPMIRPIVAGSTMAISLMLLPPFSNAAPLRLAMTLMSGGCIYGLVIFLLWYLTGKSAGPEKMVFDKVSHFFTRKG